MQLPLRRTWFTTLLLAVVSIVCGAALAQPGPMPQGSFAGPVQALHLSVALVPLTGSVEPGGSTDVGLRFVLDKGWHVYWVNAGDSGEPPRIRWRLPPGITAGAMQFPAPRRLPLGPLMDFGYEDEVLFPIVLHAAPDLKVHSTVGLLAHVDWLVCREVCIPGKAELALPLEIVSGQGVPTPALQALFTYWRTRLPQPLPSSSRAVFASTPKGFALAVTGLADDSAEFFPLDQNQIDNAAPQIVRFMDHGVEVSLKKDENLRDAPAKLSGVLRLKDATAYEVHAIPGPVPAAMAVAGSVGSPAAAGGLKIFLRIVFLAFLGGAILNLMPCVFPVLFIKGLALVESSGQTRSRLRAHGIAYALGVLVSFWAVVAVLLVLRAGGHRLGWGFQFQSPIFIAIVALLLFFLGLSLAGMFEIGLTLTSTGSSLAARSGYTGSFFTGVLATVVATPCTAPFMGAAIGFALSQSAVIAFAVFTALAMGLAVPYLLLTMNPAWTRLLPRPGAWMETLKQITAAPIFVTVIWLVWLFVQSAGATALPGLLGGFLLLSIAGWILGRWPARRPAFLLSLVVIALAVSLPIFAVQLFSTPGPSVARPGDRPLSTQEDWQPFSVAAVEQYRAQGRTVFVDFTASWCLSCQVNERVVLNRADVRRRLHESGTVLLRADWTHHDEEIAQALTNLGRSGVPTYVFYSPGEPPRILPEVLTPGIIFGVLDLSKHASNQTS